MMYPTRAHLTEDGEGDLRVEAGGVVLEEDPDTARHLNLQEFL